MRKKQRPKSIPSSRPPAVCLDFENASAREVFVAGSFNDWQLRATPLKPIGDGKWKVELPLGPGRHEYRFVVDGEWIDDPKAKEFAANPLGGRNAVLVVQPLAAG